MPLARPLALALGLLASGCAESGDFFIGWEVTEHGEDSSCKLVRAIGVALTVTGVEYGETYDYSFDCLTANNGGGAVPEDDKYTLSYRLIDAAGDTLATYSPTGDHDVKAGYETPWPRAAFAVNLPRASFKTRLGDRGDNCEATSAGGAGATRQEVRITAGAAGQCLAASLHGVKVAFGGDASAPTCRPYGCQPATQMNTIVRLWPDTFTVEIVGYQGPTSDLIECYRSAPVSFTLARDDLDIGVIVAPFLDGATRCTRP